MVILLALVAGIFYFVFTDWMNMMNKPYTYDDAYIDWEYVDGLAEECDDDDYECLSQDIDEAIAEHLADKDGDNEQ